MELTLRRIMEYIVAKETSGYGSGLVPAGAEIETYIFDVRVLIKWPAIQICRWAQVQDSLDRFGHHAPPHIDRSPFSIAVSAGGFDIFTLSVTIIQRVHFRFPINEPSGAARGLEWRGEYYPEQVISIPTPSALDLLSRCSQWATSPVRRGHVIPDFWVQSFTSIDGYRLTLDFGGGSPRRPGVPMRYGEMAAVSQGIFTYFLRNRQSNYAPFWGGGLLGGSQVFQITLGRTKNLPDEGYFGGNATNASDFLDST